MKKLITLSILAVLTLASCEDAPADVDALVASGDLEAIKSEQQRLKDENTELQLKLKKLNIAVEKAEKKKSGPLVSTMTVRDTLFNHFLELQGNVETKQNVIISAEYGGVLTRVYVNEGDRVRKGQLLARIDDGGLSSQLAQLEVQSQLAKTTYERQKRLWDQKIGSEIQFLNAKASYDASVSSINQLKAQLGKASVNAPFSGIIDEVITEQGSAVMPGSQLYRIVNLSDMYITSEVPESYLGSVKEGTSVTVGFPILGKSIESKVRQTSNFIQPTNRSFAIEVAVPNKDGMVKPNLTAKLKINDYSNENAILIPLSVISENSEGEQYVYIADRVDGGKAFAKAESKQDSAITTTNTVKGDTVARRVIVQTGRTQGDYIEILSGLKSGDEIIVKGARSVQDKQEIRILNN